MNGAAINYYPFHVGDYAAHTAHLEPMEDLAYRRLLDQYYLREGPLPADVQATAKLIRMRSMAADVESVLREFFTLTEAGWAHKRCAEEVLHMQDKQAKARTSAQASVNARKAAAEKVAADAQRALAQKQADAELPTPTPTPTPVKEKRGAEAPPPCPPDVSAQVWGDWVQLRRAKKAPVSSTAVEQVRKEADKAAMTLEAFLSVWCARGSQGLQASWLTTEERRHQPRAVEEPAWRTEQRERAAQFAGPFAAKRGAVIDEVKNEPTKLLG